MLDARERCSPLRTHNAEARRLATRNSQLASQLTMRILLLAPRIPWPPLDGGRIAMSRLAESLAASGAAVEILSLNPRKNHARADGLPLPLRAVDLDTSRRMGPALASVLRAVPYVVAPFHSRELH